MIQKDQLHPQVYSGDIELKTTNAVEIVGILCMDPRLASAFDDDERYS